MDIVPILSTIILIATVITLIVAIVSYMVFRIKERRREARAQAAISSGDRRVRRRRLQPPNPRPEIRVEREERHRVSHPSIEIRQHTGRHQLPEKGTPSQVPPPAPHPDHTVETAGAYRQPQPQAGVSVPPYAPSAGPPPPPQPETTQDPSAQAAPTPPQSTQTQGQGQGQVQPPPPPPQREQHERREERVERREEYYEEDPASRLTSAQAAFLESLDLPAEELEEKRDSKRSESRTPRDGAGGSRLRRFTVTERKVHYNTGSDFNDDQAEWK